MKPSRPYEVLVEALGEEVLYGDPVVYACLLLLAKQGETDPMIILSTTLKHVQAVKQTLQEEFHDYMAQSTGRRVLPPKLQNLPTRSAEVAKAFDMFGVDGLPDFLRKK